MDEVVNNDAANEEGEVASTPIETTETEPVVANTGKEDITQTQAFAQRLKEEKEKGISQGVQAGIDAFYEKNYGVSNGVHSEADYNAAMQQQTEDQAALAAQDAAQDRKDELEKQGVNPDQLDEFIANNAIVKKANKLILEKDKKDFIENDNQVFLDYFKKENNRPFDPVKDILPPELWEVNQLYQESLGAKGRSFIDSYQKHENSILKARLAEIEKGSTTNVANIENANSATGSVTGNGLNGANTMTEEVFNSLTPRELSKRWKEVKILKNMK